MAEMAIPEDIRAKAETIAEKIDADWSWDGLAWPNKVLAAKAASVKAIAQALLAEREAQKEKDAKIASGWKRRCLGRDINKATWDPCGRWDGGLVMENGRERDLIAAAIRRQEDGNG